MNHRRDESEEEIQNYFKDKDEAPSSSCEDLDGKKEKKIKSKERTAMTQVGNNKYYTSMSDSLLLDSGTSSHITTSSDRVECNTSFYVHIILGDESTVRESESVNLQSHWKTEDGTIQVRI